MALLNSGIVDIVDNLLRLVIIFLLRLFFRSIDHSTKDTYARETKENT